MLSLRSFARKGAFSGGGYPYDVPLLKGLEPLSFSSPVTIFCGDNGCGKTSLLELIAQNVHAVRIGSQSGLTPSQELLRLAAGHFRTVMNKTPAHCFLFTAEGFSRYVDAVVEEKRMAREDLSGIRGRYGSAYAEELAAQPYQSTLGALERMYRQPLEEQSHGQGFLDFFASRLIPGGLYLLDEPEAALSYVSQLALIHLMQDAVARGCQFLLATHSPILTACPDAALFEIRDGALTRKTYDELDSIRFLKYFLHAHEHILQGDGD